MRALRTLALLLAATALPLGGALAETGQAEIVTLGTMAGPMANPQRS